MGLLLRELAGWLFVALGLYGYWICLAFIASPSPRVIEAAIVAGVATMLFRGGLLLVRVATAARIVARSEGPSAPKTNRADKSSAPSRWPVS